MPSARVYQWTNARFRYSVSNVPASSRSHIQVAGVSYNLRPICITTRMGLLALAVVVLLSLANIAAKPDVDASMVTDLFCEGAVSIVT